LHNRATKRRLAVIFAIIATMTITLLGRLYWVQFLDPNPPEQTAGRLHDGDIVIPAPRGEIVDARGRPLVTNASTQVITVNRGQLQALPDKGTSVLERLAGLLGTSTAQLSKEITPCSPTVPAPCWTGQPYQPVPVATDVSTQTALAVSEHREQFPGVTLQTITQPDYPGGTLAAHVLGYTGAVNDADKKKDKTLVDDDVIGRTGLQAQYDSYLRGVDGKQTMLLDPRGDVQGTGATVLPEQGDTLVTSIDADLQKLVEQSILQQIADSRSKGHPATSASVVVMDPNTGRVLAAASYPTYDPQQFVGGISQQEYAALTNPSANDPLLGRAIAGEYAPGSTFKLITSSSDVMHGEISLNGTYPCPPAVAIDGRVKTNFDSESFGNIDLRTALGYSCDTFFYTPAADEYYRDQARVDAGQKPLEYLQKMAAAFGVGRAPGIDLPAGEQGSGSYADRESRLTRWQQNKATYCAQAKAGFAGQPNAAYLKQLAAENCTDGWRYHAGDNADMAIGQGETTVSPLQLALAYSALVNGGRIWQPTLGWAVVDGNGKVVHSIKPKVRNKVPVSQSLFNYIADSLNFGRGWAVSGAFAYLDSPYRSLIGGKTGTAEVYGKDDTSWLTTWGPISHDRAGNVRANLVIAGMVEQAGTGATAAGPMEKRIWDGIFGVGRAPVLAGKHAATRLPHLAPRVQVATSTNGNGSSGAGSAPATDVVPTNATRTGAKR
jgi:penicillin-binding protein 2